MQTMKVVLAALASLVLVHCASDKGRATEEQRGTARSAACVAEWTPTFAQGNGANEWWVEYAIGGGTVASAHLEIPGVGDLPLTSHWGKWAGKPTARVASGTQVVLHATTTAGAAAQSVAFGYLSEPSPAADPCAGGGGGGECNDAWMPSFAQATANEWWVEYTIGASDVATARLEVVGGATVPLTLEWGKWHGKPPARIPTGTTVIVRAESTSGKTAQTEPFRYLVDTAPATKPCGPGGGGECSDFRPTWQQGGGANDWWVEYSISTAATAARLEVSGGITVDLAFEWGKWRGGPSARIPSGTTVTLYATNAAGESASTTPFRYLVDTSPATKPCDGPPPDPGESGLDTRPANPTCVAPARPPSAAPVSLTPVFADVFTSVSPPRVQSPMIMLQRPGDASRWFLAQRDGRIVSFNASGTRDLRQVVSTAQLAALTGKTVDQGGEGGFHGMAFDPSFATNGRLYVSFATSCDGSVPACDDPKNLNGDLYAYAEEIGYLTSGDGGATFSTYTRLMQIGRWAQMHFGGSVTFGRDGYLYISSGDGLDDSAPQRKDNLFGKVLRIDVHGAAAPGKAYGIPPTNPFAGGGGLPEIFAWGFRNPFRLTVDRTTGDLWLGDVGQDTWEEVDQVELGGNYGWPCREGAHDTAAAGNTAKCPSRLGLIDPVVEHAHAGMGRSVTGGFVYRGAAIAGFQGTYVYGDFIQKELRSLTLVNGTWTSSILNANGPNDGYVSFAEDAAGELYSVALFDQKIHKLVPSGAPPATTFPQRLSETGCVLSNDPKTPAAGVIPFDVNAALWSDGAAKQRWLAVPDGARITVKADGDFDFPIGSVLLKTFSLGGKRIETRLFVRHTDGEWGGYSYEWDDAQSDATLLPASKVKDVGGQSWFFPGRNECFVCHTTGAGRSLGLEIGQLNRTIVYPSTQRTANQLTTLQHIGMFAASIGDPATLTAYPKPFDGAPTEAKARSYLHANCAGCHRPSGGAGRSTMDWRFATPLSSTKACNATPLVDDFGNTTNRLVKPGAPGQSIVSLRMHATNAKRMPPLATALVDAQGTSLIDAWIGALAGCP